jgi:hypothetical protein
MNGNGRTAQTGKADDDQRTADLLCGPLLEIERWAWMWYVIVAFTVERYKESAPYPKSVSTSIQLTSRPFGTQQIE